MAVITPIIAALVAAGTSIYASEKAAKEKRKFDKKTQQALAAAPDYKPAEASKNMLIEAAAGKNAINPAIQMGFQQAQQGAANQSAFAQRNATSGAEALSVGSMAQNNLQSLTPQLAADQTAYSQANRGNYNQALANMTEEERLAFESKRAKNNDLTNYYLGRTGAANANQSTALMSGVGSLAQAGNAYGRYRSNQNGTYT